MANFEREKEIVTDRLVERFFETVKITDKLLAECQRMLELIDLTADTLERDDLSDEKRNLLVKFAKYLRRRFNKNSALVGKHVLALGEIESKH